MPQFFYPDFRYKMFHKNFPFLPQMSLSYYSDS